jgi:hypothetical protein
MADFLDSDDFDQVRELLGVDAGELPDGVIEGFAYLEAAELEVKRRVAGWAEHLLTADGLTRLKAATAYLTAARLVSRQRNRQRSSEDVGPVNRGAINWDALKADLEAEASDLIEALQPDTDEDDPPVVSIFTVTGRHRRRTGVYW